MKRQLLTLFVLSALSIIYPLFALSAQDGGGGPSNTWHTVCDNLTGQMYPDFQPDRQGLDIDFLPNGCSHRIWWRETAQTPLHNIDIENEGVLVVLSMRPGFSILPIETFTTTINIGIWYKLENDTEDVNWYSINTHDTTDWLTVELYINEANVNQVQIHSLIPWQLQNGWISDYLEMDNIHIIPNQINLTPTPTETATNTPVPGGCDIGEDYFTSLSSFTDNYGGAVNPNYALGVPDGNEAELSAAANSWRYYAYSLDEVISGTIEITTVQRFSPGVWSYRAKYTSTLGASVNDDGWLTIGQYSHDTFSGQVGSIRLGYKGWPTGGGPSYVDAVQLRLINGCEATPTPTPTPTPFPTCSGSVMVYDFNLGSTLGWYTDTAYGTWMGNFWEPKFYMETKAQLFIAHDTLPFDEIEYTRTYVTSTNNMKHYRFYNDYLTTSAYNYDLSVSQQNIAVLYPNFSTDGFRMRIQDMDAVEPPESPWFFHRLEICGLPVLTATQTPQATLTPAPTITPTATTTPTITMTPRPTVEPYPTATPYPTYTDYPVTPAVPPTFGPPGTPNATPIITPIPTPEIISDTFYSDFYYSLNPIGTECHWLIPPIDYINFVGIQLCFEWYALRVIAFGIEYPVYWFMAAIGLFIVWRVFIKTVG